MLEVIQPEPVTFKVLAKEGDDPKSVERTRGHRYRMRRYQEFAIHNDYNAHDEFEKCVVVDVDDHTDDAIRYFYPGGKIYPQKAA